MRCPTDNDCYIYLYGPQCGPNCDLLGITGLPICENINGLES